MPPRAQPGEGIVVVLDVGPGVRAGTDTTFFSQSKQCLINILQRKIYAEKCRDKVGIVLCGCNETENALSTDSQYRNIKVLEIPEVVTWGIIRQVEKITGGKESGDWLDALVIAMDLLHDPDELRYSNKRIILMTDFSGEFSDDQTTQIIVGLNNHGIELAVIGPEIMNDDEDDEDTKDDIDDSGPSNGIKATKNGSTPITRNWNGKPKTSVQLAGEALITSIVNKLDEGVICSFDDAIPQLLFFQKRSSSSANWNTLLDVGPNFQIAITGRIKVKHSTPPTWKTMYAHDDTGVIIKEGSHHLNDEAQTAVDDIDVISGYRYGSTLVPVTEEDFQMLKYTSDSPRSLSVLGYAPSSNVPPNIRAGDQVLVITAREEDEVGAVALSALIQALAELDYVGITRRIYNKNSNPALGVLIPEITKEYECLIWIPLPFKEDVRMYTFPSLKRTIEKLSDSEKNAMDDLISSMNLTGDDKDEEELDPTMTLNPQLQHYFNMMTHRALHEHDPLPPPADHIVNILEPPAEMVKKHDKVAARLASLFPTKTVVKRTKRDNEDLFASKVDDNNKKQKLDEDVSASASDLSRALVTKVTSATPVHDFNALLRGEAPNFVLICNQMGKIILQLVDSAGGTGPASEAIFSKIVDCLTIFRQESCVIDPSTYNKFIAWLKDTVTLRDLRNLWSSVKEGNLGQINTNESLKSDISVEAAHKFLELEEQLEQAVPESKAEKADDDFEDLLDDL